MPFTSETETQSIRFNFSISDACKADVKKYLKLAGVFNGMSDFLGSAIREFCLKFLNMANKTLSELNAETDNPSKTLELLDNSLHKLAPTLMAAFKNKYGTKLNCQIAIRLSQSFIANMTVVSNYMGINTQDLARISLYEYLNKFPVELGQAFEFDVNYEKLYQSVHGDKTVEYSSDKFVKQFLDSD